MTRTPPFFVGTDSDARSVRRAISGLRAMVRLGRIAQAALDNISSKGSSDSRAPWVKFHHSAQKRRIVVSNIAVSTFSAYSAPRRSDVPDTSGLEVEVGPVLKAEKYRFSEVFAPVPVLVSRDEWRWDTRRKRIGYLRYTQSGGSFQPVYEEDEDGSWKSYVIRLRKKDQGSRDLSTVASCLAMHMVGGVRPSDPRTAEFSRSLRSWLVEDGTASRMLVSLGRVASRFALVDSVLRK